MLVSSPGAVDALTPLRRNSFTTTRRANSIFLRPPDGAAPNSGGPIGREPSLLSEVDVGLRSVEHSTEPTLGRRYVQQRCSLGKSGVVGAQRGENSGVFGDRSLSGAGLDRTAPRTTASGAAGNAIQHRCQRCIASCG